MLRERFGRTLVLPGRETLDCARATRDGGGVREWDAQIAALKGAFAVRVAPEAHGSMGAPVEGDGVLMVAAGRRRSLGHHIGLWCAVAGEPYVLHCLRGTGSILHPIRDLSVRALELEGVYRWI